MCGYLTASLTEGEGLAVVLHNEPLEVPPHNTVLEGNVEVLCFSPAMKL
jgi:hypothetical protein